MANYAQTSKNFTGQYMTNLAGVNTGLIIPWGSASIPSGFLECNGASVSTTTYAALFAVIGYTYGGSGASFNLPDLTDRTVVNKSNTKTLASSGGANTVTTSGNVSISGIGNTTLDTNTIAAHTHANWRTPSMRADKSGGGSTAASMNSSSTGGSGAHTHTVSSATFAGGSDSVLQPYLTLIYIIKT